MNTLTGSQTLFFAQFLLLLLISTTADAQRRTRRPPVGGKLAVVVDERLSALRSTPDLAGDLLQRLSRGRLVAIRARYSTREGIIFYRVRISSRTQGWIQKEAVLSPFVTSDDVVLLRLIKSSHDFDRLARAKIFLDNFRRSPLRPQILLLYADTAEASALKLSQEAARRLDGADTAAKFSYFMNYTGLDRYNRQGVKFIFDRVTKQFHYNGTAWREILRRYPNTPEAAHARERLASVRASVK